MTNTPFRYIASDMDGTLLSPQKVLSDATKETLKKLALTRDVTMMFATGRNHYDVRLVNEKLQQYIAAGTPADQRPSKEIYFLTSNGAVVHNAVTGELVCERCLDPALAEELYSFVDAESETINTNIYQHEEWICRINWPEMLASHKESGLTFSVCANPPDRVTFSGEDAKTKTIHDGCFQGISKMFFIFDNPADLPPFSEKFLAKFGSRSSEFSYTFSADDCMDVMAPGVHKGNSVRMVLDILRTKTGETLEEALASTVAFGDGMNDVEMLKECGKGFVMGNADPGLKAACPDLPVAPSNKDDGVAQTLHQIYELDA